MFDLYLIFIEHNIDIGYKIENHMILENTFKVSDLREKSIIFLGNTFLRIPKVPKVVHNYTQS